MTKTRLRIRFTKCGDLRWISHRDLARVWERLLRRAQLELAFSQGFHPKPKISFPSALPLGVEALDEVVELEVVGEFDLEKIRVDIERELPAGMQLLSLESPPEGAGKAKMLGSSYRIELAPEWREKIPERIRQVLEEGCLEADRDGKRIECRCDDPNFELRLDGDFLHFSLPAAAQGTSMRPSELLQVLGLEGLLADGITLQRTEVHLSCS